MMLDYFYGQSGELFAYFRIPKALFQDSRFRQLSTDARTLYGILLDRMSLSAKNSWVDEHGRVYIIYTVREVQESLCCAEHKAVKLFRELEQADLIERKRRGLGRPSLIYVKNFSSGLPKAQIQNCANSNSCAAESAVQVRPKSQSNKTDKNKTERNHPFLPDETDRLTQREQLEDQALLKGQRKYPVALGKDPLGCIIRLDNSLNNFPERITSAENELATLKQQQEAAQIEVEKPFPQEEELAEKSARLAELNAQLDMDEKGHEPEQDEEEQEDEPRRPSVLAALEEKTDKTETVKPFKSFLDKDGDAR